MASSDFWQRLSSSLASSAEWEAGVAGSTPRGARGAAKLGMVLDAVTVFVAAMVATLYKLHATPVQGARDIQQGALIHGHPTWTLLALLCGFTFALIMTSRRLHLYTPARLPSFLHEQRLSAQACLTSGLLLTGALYLVRADSIPRGIVLGTVGLVAVALGFRRLVNRILLYRRFDRGLGTRNVLIVGTGPEAHALRHHVESIRHLGYTFKGFIELPGSDSRAAVTSSDVVGTLDTLFQHTRKQFIDEIFFTTPCEREHRPECAGSGARPRRRFACCSRNVRRRSVEQPHRVHRPVSHYPAAPRRGAGTGAVLQARLRYGVFHSGACGAVAAARGHRHRGQAGFARPGFLHLRAHRQRRAWFFAASSSAPWSATPKHAAPKSCT